MTRTLKQWVDVLYDYKNELQKAIFFGDEEKKKKLKEEVDKLLNTKLEEVYD